MATRAVSAPTEASRPTRTSAPRGAALVPVGVVLVSELEMDGVVVATLEVDVLHKTCEIEAIMMQPKYSLGWCRRRCRLVGRNYIDVELARLGK